MSSRATGTSSLMQMYCCFKRDPQALCSRLKEIARLASVAEKSFTGIDTSPNETVNDAIDRAAMLGILSRQPQGQRLAADVPIVIHEDFACPRSRLERGAVPETLVTLTCDCDICCRLFG